MAKGWTQERREEQRIRMRKMFADPVFMAKFKQRMKTLQKAREAERCPPCVAGKHLLCDGGDCRCVACLDLDRKRIKGVLL